ncbi:MAG: hypothetical protein K2W82_15625 [Candidatus Obscuribacterales bacterium]|nr:hypothetical protein [Candidatus Obscuribacterales bacterium]
MSETNLPAVVANEKEADFLEICRQYPAAIEAASQTLRASHSAKKAQQAAQKLRNQAADALDEAIMEYAAARQARRAYHTWNDELKQRQSAAWDDYNDTKHRLKKAAENGDENQCRELGAKVAQLNIQREEVGKQTIEAIQNNPKEWEINNRMTKATEAKTAAQKALDAADAELEAANKLAKETEEAYQKAHGAENILADKVWLWAEAAYIPAAKPIETAADPQETDKIISH